VLVGPDDAILMHQGNIDTVHHAETEFARRAATAYSPELPARSIGRISARRALRRPVAWSHRV
jgi:hypothetical protein